MQFCGKGYFVLLAALSIPATTFASTFANGDFELPGANTFFLSGSADTGVTGWTYNWNGTGFESYSHDADYGITADSGSYFITFGHNGTTGGSLSQTFDTISGHTYAVNYQLILQQVGAQLTQSVGLQAFNAVDSSSLGTVQTDFDFLTWSPGVTLLFTASSTSSTITFTDLTDVANSGPLNWDLDTVTVSDVVSPVTSGTPEPGSLFMLGGALIALTARYRHSRS